MYHKFKCALFGTGRQATRLLEVIRQNNFEFAALLTREIHKGKAFLKHFGYEDVWITNNIEEILALPDLQVIFITTPDFLHFTQALQCINANKHVYLEKPLATNFADGIQLLESASKNDSAILFIGYHLRGVSSITYLKELIDSQYFGEIQSIQITWGYKPETINGWRNDLSPWWCASMLGTHCLDLILWFFSLDSVVGYSGKLDNKIYHKKDDSCTINLNLKHNIEASITCSLEQNYPLTIEIISAKGKFIFDKILGEQQTIDLPGSAKRDFQYSNPWDNRVRNFVSYIQNSIHPNEQLLASLVNIFILENLTKHSAEADYQLQTIDNLWNQIKYRAKGNNTK